MKNCEFYKTSKEQTEAFLGEWASTPHVDHSTGAILKSFSEWLDKDTTVNKVLPCPFCGGKCNYGGGRVFCETPDCYVSKLFPTDEEAIDAHNVVSRSVIARLNGVR